MWGDIGDWGRDVGYGGRGISSATRGWKGAASGLEKMLGSFAGLVGSQGGIPGGYDEGAYRMTRSGNKLAREEMRGEPYRDGYGQRSRMRRGGGGGELSEESLVMLEELRQNPEVQAELEKHGLSVEDTMWDGLDTATVPQIVAAARAVERQHKAQAGGGSAAGSPTSAPAAPAGYAHRDEYMRDLGYAAAMGSPWVQPGNEEASWEQKLADYHKDKHGGRLPPDEAAHQALQQHIRDLEARKVSVAPAPAAAAAADTTPTEPYDRTVTSEPLPSVGSGAAAPVFASRAPVALPSYAAAPTSSYTGLDAEGSQYFNTYGGLHRGMEDDPQVMSMQGMINVVSHGNLKVDGDYGNLTGKAVSNLRQSWGMGEGRADSDFLNRLSHEYNQIAMPTASLSQQVSAAALPASVSGGETVVASSAPPPATAHNPSSWDVHRS